MKKRLLALFLCFVLTVSLLPASALAEEEPVPEAVEEEVTSLQQTPHEDGLAEEEPSEAETSEEQADAVNPMAGDGPEGEPEKGQTAPESITVEYAGTQIAPDGKLIGKTGDTFQFRALDQDGNETPVTWSGIYTWTGTIDENGLLTVTTSLSPGSTSYLYPTATSTLDTTVKAEGRFSLTGYQFSSYSRNQSVALSVDGQTAKTASVSAGYDGSTIWTLEGLDGIACLSDGYDLGQKKTSLKFDLFRPGTITASFVLDFDESMTDTAAITITGVAVEDPDGVQGKTYLTATTAAPNPSVQLTAYTAADRSVTGWSSSDEAVATVDENGLVTARGVGTALITATDSGGTNGGIKVVVQSGDTPYFENLQFLTSALSDWNASTTFSATKLEYPLTIRAYSTTKLTLQATTLYDADRYTAEAAYPGIDGQPRQVSVNSGKITYLEDIPFDQFDLTITLADKAAPENKTVYTFHVTRPRDTTKTLKSSGVVLQPDGRALSATLYNGKAEGTMFRLNEDGTFYESYGSVQSGVAGNWYRYKCYALDSLARFSLNVSGSTSYTHLRYSTDSGATWTEMPQGGGVTDVISFPEKTGEDNASVTVLVNVLDDQTYADNEKAGKDGFADSGGQTYTVTVEQAAVSAASAQILTAETAAGDWYPAFAPGSYSYTVILPAGITTMQLRYTAAEGAVVKLGSYNAVEQAPDAGGVYTLELTSSNQMLTVTSADGSISNSYTFIAKARTTGAPDKVTDYLCINSQYTNGGSGSNPQGSLYDSAVSLGNFGGYITYYYENGLRDDPANQYGVDFHVKGNANVDVSTSTKTSFFEPAQIWVSEDGETWYALAGSAHYDDGVDWNYTVTYRKTATGKTAWTDNHGNANDGSRYAGVWPSQSVYPLNAQAGSDTITLSGIVLPSRSGDLAVSGQAVDAYPTQWGYADCQTHGTKNPYLDNSNYDLASSGFDLAWAVDANGLPVDVSEKEFHYVKIQTASNIWHSSFGEKSPEIASVARAEAQGAAVGKTDMPEGVTITDGAGSLLVRFTQGQQVYSIDVGDMKYVSIAVNGAAADDNIYVNNRRLAAGEALEGIRVTKEDGTRLVRVLVQNGDKEPFICVLKLTGSASSSDDLIEGVKVNAGGSVRTAATKNGKTYRASVGCRIDEISIIPVAAPDVTLEVDGEALKDSYSLSEGENTFVITSVKDSVQHTVTLTVTREAVPAVTGIIKVWFTLLGDEAHGTPADADGTHTLAAGNLDTWIENTAYELDAPAMVLDVLELALKDRYTYVNADGNYISEIGSLAEFDNGAKSGWMYTLNGTYSEKGVAEQSVKNGDRIVFHFTDDYTKERACEQWSGSSGGTATKPEDKAETTLTPEVEVNSDGEASAIIDEKTIDNTVAQAKTEQADVIVIAPEVKGDASKVSVELPKSGVDNIARQTDADLKVETDIADITIPQKSLDDLAGRSGSKVTISAEAVRDTDNVKLEIAVDGKPVGKLSGGITVSVPARAENSGNVLVLVNADGTEKIVKKSITDGRTVEAVLDGSCTVKVVDNSKRFDDTVNHWSRDAAAFASSHGLFSGVTANTFAPDTPMSRAMLATVLYRLEDAVAAGSSAFADVPEGTWYTDAVTWASSAGIVTGTGSGFDPNGNVTREQLAAMLYRYAKTLGMSTGASGDLSRFSDGGKTSGWARDAMEWAVGSGLISGKGNSVLDPTGSATRAEVAVIMQRLIGLMVK